MMAVTSTHWSCLRAFESSALVCRQGRNECRAWTASNNLRTPFRSAELLGFKKGAGAWPLNPSKRSNQPCPRCQQPSSPDSSDTKSLPKGTWTTRRRALIAESVAGRKPLSTPPCRNSAAGEAPRGALSSEGSRRSVLLFSAGVLLSAHLTNWNLPALAESTGASSNSNVATSEPGAVRKKLDAARKEEEGDGAVKVEVYKDERRPVTKDEVLDDYEKKLLTYNRKIQKLNNAPRDFPGFIREGYDVRVVTSPDYKTSSSGLLFKDYDEGTGPQPEEGQQVIFHYTGYNESGKRVDSSYQQNRPAETRIGIKGMIAGFEEGIKTMRVGGKRRVIVPPDLGPPTGPSTFFSAKQFEVFDIELLGIKNCKRRQIAFYSDLVCDDVVAEIPAELK